MAEARLKHWIQEVREALGLTQASFADRLGVSYAAVQKWEGGKREPRPKMKMRIVGMAPPQIQTALGIYNTEGGKGTGIMERLEAVEKTQREQGRAIAALEQKLKRRAS